MITKKKLNDYLKQHFPDAWQRRSSLEVWLVRLLCRETGTNVESRLRDIATHGCVSGCVSELVYYADCEKFYAKFESQIWEMVEDFCEQTGDTFAHFIAGFRDTIDSPRTFKTRLAWFSVEAMADRLLMLFAQS